MSVVTYAELRAGLEMQQRNRDHDEKVLAPLVQRILRAAIRDRRSDALDRLIAAHAIATGAVLVTKLACNWKTGMRPERSVLHHSSSQLSPSASACSGSA